MRNGKPRGSGVLALIIRQGPEPAAASPSSQGDGGQFKSPRPGDGPSHAAPAGSLQCTTRRREDMWV